MSSTKSLVKFRIKFIIIIALICLGIFLSVFISGVGAPKQANVYSKAFANVSETVLRFCERFNYSNNDFDEYNVITSIPETKNGYIPQGYCYCEEQKIYAISYYHDEKPSIIALIDAETNLRVKSIILYENEEKVFSGHAGGIGNDSEYLYLTCNGSVARISFEAINQCEDYGKIILNEYFCTDVKCSYLNCDGEYLYVGEFYTNDGNYPTDDSHHIMMTPLEISFARVNVYNIKSLGNDFATAEKEMSIPEYSLAVRERVQGIAKGEDGTFYLSISYGRKNYSYLEKYKNVFADSPDYKYMVGEKEIPVYFLDKDSKTDTITLPPMLEGIDYHNGRLTGIFESGAEKYSDARFIENSICEFKMK